MPSFARPACPFKLEFKGFKMKSIFVYALFSVGFFATTVHAFAQEKTETPAAKSQGEESNKELKAAIADANDALDKLSQAVDKIAHQAAKGGKKTGDNVQKQIEKIRDQLGEIESKVRKEAETTDEKLRAESGELERKMQKHAREALKVIGDVFEDVGKSIKKSTEDTKTQEKPKATPQK